MKLKLEDALELQKIYLGIAVAATRSEMQAQSELQRIKAYHPASSEACPLCQYHDGIFVKACGFHEGL